MRRYLLVSVLILTARLLQAQISITPNSVVNGVQMVDKIVGTGVTYSNVQLSCKDTAAGIFISQSNTGLGIDSGIVLTSGRSLTSSLTFGGANGVNRPAAVVANNINYSPYTDSDYDSLTTTSYHDLCMLEFDFVPSGDTIQFNYKFASDEYTTYNCQVFNDLFAFFISGPGITGAKNVALVPGTTIPVAINSINNGVASAANIAANCNSMGTGSPFTSLYVTNAGNMYIVYNGSTVKLTAKQSVIPCSTYHMKFAIADVYDPILDSGVFIEANSFTSNAVVVDSFYTPFGAAVSGNVGIEGCLDDTIVLKRPIAVPYPTQVSISSFGTATAGIDYTAIPSILTIPANQTEISIPFVALNDNIAEGIEYVTFYLNGIGCPGYINDSITVYIHDFPQFSVTGNTTICNGDSTLLTVSQNVYNQYLSFNWMPGNINNDSLLVQPSSTSTYSINASFPACPTQSQNITVNVQQFPVVDAGLNDSICAGGSGQFNPVITTFGQALNYQWQPTSGLSSSTTVNPNVSNSVSTTYTLVASTSAGCSDSDIVNLIVLPTFTLSLAATNSNCSGALGGIQATVNPTQSGINYTLQPGNISNNSGLFNNLNTGTYTVTAVNSGLCSTTATVAVIAGPQVNISASASSILCFGQNAGIVATASLGTSPYQYSLNNGTLQNNGNFSNVAAGNYTVVVQDANNCTQSTTLNITQPSQLAVTTNYSPILCQGNATTIVANANGGSAAYTYSLNAAAFIASNSFSGVSAGNYTITLKDLNNCSASTTLAVTEPTNLTLSLNHTPILCNGLSTNITANAGGGASGYTYSLNSGAYQAGNVFNSLAAGTYTLTVKDANNCTVTSTHAVTQPTALSMSASSGAIACFGGNTNISVNAAGGSGAFTYSLNGGTYQVGNNFSNQTSGNYTLTVKDANNCSISTSINITQPSAINVTASAPAILCNGGTTTITANANGGSAAYTYSLNAAAFIASNSFSGVSAGNYTIIVKDLNNCSASTTLAVTEPTNLTLSLNHSPILCNGLSTNITANAGGGASGYAYSLNSGAYQAGNVFNSLAAGTYTLTVKDANNCTVSSTITITQPTALSMSASSGAIACFGGNTNISVNATGGSGAFTYSLNGGTYQAGNNFSNQTSGNYTLTVKDANNCSISTSINITQPSAVNVTASAPAILCNGGTTTITANANGGSSAYTYSLNAAAYVASNSFSGVGVGTFTITAKDVNNCASTTSMSITQPSAVNISNISNTIPSCSPGNDASITVSANGGTAALTYQLNNNPVQSSNIFNAIGLGVYTITVYDANACSASSNINVVAPMAPAISAININPIDCYNNTTATAQVVAGGINTPLTYSLSGSGSNGVGTFNNLAAAAYTATVTDALGCNVSSVFTITQPTALSISASSGAIACFGGNTNISVNATGGSGAFTYSLNGGTYQPANSFSNQTSGNYTLTVKDANNCSISTSINITQPSAINVTASAPTILCNGGTTTITANANGGSAAYTYSLNAAAFVASNSFSGVGVGTFTITAKDVNNCASTTSISITQPSAVNIANISNTIPSCSPGNDASITVNTNGGTATLTYQLNNNPVQSSNIFNAIGLGVYTITVYDANACSASSNINVVAPMAPAISAININPIDCYNNTTATAQVVAGGINTPLSYSLSGSGSNGVGAFNNLAAAAYTATVTDALGCNVSSVFTITQPTALSMSASSGTIACFGGNTNISVNATGGSGSFTYSLNGGTYQSANNFSNQTSGNYTLTVKDANNCSISTSINITQPSAINVTASAPTILCNGGTTTITANANGGSAAYTYSLNAAAFVASNSFSGVGVGTFTITAKDVNNCASTTSIIITQPSAVNISNISNTIPSCSPGNDASITVSANGGTAALTYQLNNNPAQSSNIFNAIGLGVYTITVYDANACSASSSVNIIAPMAPAISAININPIDCYNNTTATAQVVAGGINTPLTYSLSGSGSNGVGTFNNLAAAAYTATVTDALGCNVSSVFTITQPTALSMSASSGAIACFGGNTNISVNATGGSGSFTYSLNGGTYQAGNNFSNQTSGNYTLTVKDANNCSISTSINITQPSAINVTASAPAILCNGGTTTIAASANGGSAAYTYSLNAAAFVASNSFSSVGVGTFTITAKDVNNCASTTSISITQPSAVNITNISNTIPSCSPGNDASIAVSANGGTAALTYQLNNNPVQSSNIFNAIGLGVYTITVYDANACSASSSVNIIAPMAPAISAININPIDCYNNTTATAQVVASGINTPLTYSLSGSGSNSFGTFNNLAAAAYTATVTDALGCNVSSVFTITQPTALSMSASSGAIACFGGNTNISVNATGGSGSFTYSLNGGTYQSANNFSNQTSGNYTLTVKDANNCSISTSINITQPSAINVTASAPAILCNGGTTTITASANGGSAAYTYSLNAAAFVASNSFSGVGVGTFTITAKDVNNCASTTSISITQPSAVNITNISNTIPSCSPGNDASITVSANGGNAALTYQLNNNPVQSSNIFNAIGLGVYTITVYDANACSASSNINVVAPMAPAISAINTTPETCIPANDGTILVTAINGSPLYTYSLNNISYQSSSVFVGLTQGFYTVYVKDSKGCTASSLASIAQTNSPNISALSSTAASCAPGSDGSITVSASGGVGPYEYSLNNAVYQTSGLFVNLPAGVNYTVYAKDNNGCTSSSNIMVNTVNGPAISNVSHTQPSCNGSNNAGINITVVGGSPAYIYSINPTIGINNANGNFSNLIAGTYSVVATDQNGCSISTVVNINQPSGLQINQFNQTPITCYNANNGIVLVQASGGTGSISYSISPGGTNGSGQFNNLNANQTYTITAQDIYGCSTSTNATFVNPVQLNINQILSDSVLCNAGNSGGLTVIAGGTGQLQYKLLPNNIINTSGQFSSLTAGNYTVIVSDANNCSTQSAASVLQSPSITINNLNKQNVQCFGQNNGSIQVSAVGGSGVLSYQLNNNPPQTNGVFQGLGGSIYTIVISDANNCSISTGVSIIEPSPLSFTAFNATDVTCYSYTNGQISASAIGGSGQLTYTLIPGNNSNLNGQFNALPVNAYHVIVSDANNCSMSSVAIVSEPAQLSISLDYTKDNICQGDNQGVFAVSANGGVPTYTFSMQPNTGIQNIDTFSQLPAGTYTIEVSDANQCSTLIQGFIDEPPAVVFTLKHIKHNICYGDKTGELIIEAQGGSGQLLYYLDSIGTFNAVSIASYQNLAAKTYTIYTVDANLCSASTTISITENTKIQFDSIRIVEPKCAGLETGAIFVEAIGGMAPLTYIFNNGPAKYGCSEYNLAATTYPIRITDIHNCILDTFITINEPDSVRLFVDDVKDVSCFGSTNGEIFVHASGGADSQNYVYYISPSIFVNTDGHFIHLGDGYYEVVAKDVNGCTVTSSVVIEVDIDTIHLNLDIEHMRCDTAYIFGSAAVQIDGGTAPYNYMWDNTFIFDQPKIEGLGHGYHYIEVTDAFGCVEKDTFEVFAPPCCELQFPNAFSPNNDNKNDKFRPLTRASYELAVFQVFNRWGDMIYSSNSNLGWDGKQNGKDCDLGIYYYMVRYKCMYDEKIYTIKGDVTLLK